jgi:hypothetical protein
MSSPPLTPDQVAHISIRGAGYTTDQRQKAFPNAVPLSLEQRAPLEGFSPPQVLDTRLLFLGETRVESPGEWPDKMTASARLRIFRYR